MSLRCRGSVPIRLTVLIALLCGASSFQLSCAHNVAQDSATGNDGKVKGAKEFELENGEGRSKGIVTYPGGDRVDWKKFTLPKDKVGNLDIRLKWKSPRPNLDLAFEVYDEWYHVVGSAKPRKDSSKTTKRVTVENAKGTYYVQVYASKRSDAGEYTLSVNFEEGTAIAAGPVPDPPRLPAVPLPPKPCDAATFDQKNPGCAKVCPQPADPSWPGCSGVCPSPADPNLPACQATMPCSNPPDRRIKACTPNKFPVCNPTERDPGNPNCDGFRQCLKGRVINVTSDGGTVITINRGSEKGVANGWKGSLMKSAGVALDKGSFTIFRVTKRESFAKTSLSVDIINRNKDAEICEN